MAAIRPDARVLAVGAPGTGKSTLLRWIFATQMGPRAGHTHRVLIDPQDVYELVPEHGTCEARGPGQIDWRAELIRVYPERGTVEEWDAVYAALNDRPNVCAWLDEAVLVAPSSRPSSEIRRYQTGGRKFGRAHLVAAQFPVAIDRTLVDSAEHRFTFVLDRPEDISRMAGMMRLSRQDLDDAFAAFPPTADTRPHNFLWHQAATGRVVVHEPVAAQQLEAADKVVRALR